LSPGARTTPFRADDGRAVRWGAWLTLWGSLARWRIGGLKAKPYGSFDSGP
jgi:hypothetical protein